MQAITDLVFLLGMDGTYIEVFSAAAEDLYLPREHLIGQKVTDVLPRPNSDNCRAAESRKGPLRAEVSQQR